MQKQITLFFKHFQKSCFLLGLCYHVLLCFIVLVSCIFSYFFLNYNNPTAFWLRLMGMHNEKIWFLKNVQILSLPSFLNESMIQWSINKYSYSLHSWMNQLFKWIGWINDSMTHSWRQWLVATYCQF